MIVRKREDSERSRTTISTSFVCGEEEERDLVVVKMSAIAADSLF